MSNKTLMNYFLFLLVFYVDSMSDSTPAISIYS